MTVSDEPDTAEFAAPDADGWHYTMMRDWIAVCPAVSATSARLYWIIRSLMLEKGGRAKRLSIDELCWLLPGINGKATSETRVKDALRELEHVGLLSNPDGNVVRRWVYDPRTGEQTRENYRRWHVHDFPAASYDGPKSAFDLLDEYPGLGWREAATTEGRKSDPQQTAQPSPAETPTSPAHTEGRISDQTRRKSDQTRRKSDDFDALTSENTPANKSLIKRTTTNQPTSRPDSASLLNSDAEQVHREVGWLEADQPRGEEQHEPGRTLLASLPAPWLLGRHAQAELAPRVTALLAAGWPPATLIGRWTSRPATKSPLGALRYRIGDTPDAPPAIAATRSPLPPACDNCLRDNPGARLNLRFRVHHGTPCPACHPDAQRADKKVTA